MALHHQTRYGGEGLDRSRDARRVAHVPPESLDDHNQRGGVATLDGDYAQEMVDTIRLWRSLNWLTIATAAVILTSHLLAILNFNNPRRTKEGIS